MAVAQQRSRCPGHGPGLVDAAQRGWLLFGSVEWAGHTCSLCLNFLSGGVERIVLSSPGFPEDKGRWRSWQAWHTGPPYLAEMLPAAHHVAPFMVALRISTPFAEPRPAAA